MSLPIGRHLSRAAASFCFLIRSMRRVINRQVTDLFFLSSPRLLLGM